MWTNPQNPVDLVIFTEDILNGKLHFLCSIILGLPNAITNPLQQSENGVFDPNVLFALDTDFPKS